MIGRKQRSYEVRKLACLKKGKAPAKKAAPAAPAAAVAQTVAAPVAPVAPVAAPVLAASTGNKTQGKLATVTILSRAQMKEQL